jgi:hypothetical protein
MLIDTGSPVYCQQYLDKIRSIAIQNKYLDTYLRLCTRAASRNSLSKFDRHHIVPSCFNLGGESDPSSIVNLTLREHFVAHLLLAKMFTGKQEYQMNAAAFLMAGRCQRSRQYEYLRLKRDRDHGPLHSVILKKSHSLDPTIQVRRAATMAAKPTLICPNCGRDFRYPVSLNNHECKRRCPKSSSTLKELILSGRLDMAKVRAAQKVRPELRCDHCDKIFRFPAKWRKHKGCRGNP